MPKNSDVLYYFPTLQKFHWQENSPRAGCQLCKYLFHLIFLKHILRNIIYCYIYNLYINCFIFKHLPTFYIKMIIIYIWEMKHTVSEISRKLKLIFLTTTGDTDQDLEQNLWVFPKCHFKHTYIQPYDSYSSHFLQYIRGLVSWFFFFLILVTCFGYLVMSRADLR